MNGLAARMSGIRSLGYFKVFCLVWGQGDLDTGESDAGKSAFWVRILKISQMINRISSLSGRIFRTLQIKKKKREKMPKNRIKRVRVAEFLRIVADLCGFFIFDFSDFITHFAIMYRYLFRPFWRNFRASNPRSVWLFSVRLTASEKYIIMEFSRIAPKPPATDHKRPQNTATDRNTPQHNATGRQRPKHTATLRITPHESATHRRLPKKSECARKHAQPPANHRNSPPRTRKYEHANQQPTQHADWRRNQ